MLVEKEVISPGTYWYVDEATGKPRSMEVTPDWTKYWCEQGNEMLKSGLRVPVPYEHDFNQHPMTPKDKLLNNAGEIKEYKLKGNALFSVVDVQDDKVKDKIGKSVKWTSPWINSFTDGNGKRWNNVISHLALTTRPRITKQEPFPSVAAALSIASPVDNKINDPISTNGFCLSKAGKLVKNVATNKLRPLYPMAFSLLTSGAKFAEDDDVKPLKKKEKSESKESEGGSNKSKSSDKESSSDNSSSENESENEEYKDSESEFTVDVESKKENSPPPFKNNNPMGDRYGDVRMEEILCDLLNALGIFMPENVGESEFRRALYEAAMGKIKELTSRVNNDLNNPAQPPPPTGPKPLGGNPQSSQNPIMQQEQQPMYMSLEEIHKLPEPTRGVALAMYTENAKLRTEVEANAKLANSLRDSKLKEASLNRDSRISLLGRRSPSTKADLESMKALPTMALSMGDNGEVVDPMSNILSLLEKSLVDVPKLLTVDAAALSIQAPPTDGMSQEEIDRISDDYARMMGAPAITKSN